jgi:aspartate kinase
MTADPQMVPQALCLPRISYAQCHALAQEGAKVLHPRAVALAMAHGLSVRVRSNFSDEEGTLVARSVSLEARTPTNPTFTGVAQRDRLIHVEFGNPQGTLSEVLFALSREKIGLEGVAMHEQRVTCTLSESDWARALQVMQAEGCTLYGEVPCARVTVVGEGIQHHPHVQAGLLSTLGEAQIPVLQLGDIRDGVWCLVEQRHLQAALGILHQTFVVHTQKTSKSQVPFVRRVLSTKDPVPVPAAR